jgi:hypothetical protein
MRAVVVAGLCSFWFASFFPVFSAVSRCMPIDDSMRILLIRIGCDSPFPSVGVGVRALLEGHDRDV